MIVKKESIGMSCLNFKYYLLRVYAILSRKILKIRLDYK